MSDDETLSPPNPQNSQTDDATSKSNNDAVGAQVSGILKSTLQDNDFLQSFVRIGLEDSSNVKYTKEDKRDAPKSATNLAPPRRLSKSAVENKDKGRRSSVRFSKESVNNQLELEKSKKRRRRRRSDVTFRQEEVYTDKDRAAAVNLGSRDIKQSLKMKRRQDRSRDFQIPEEAEPSAMLALGNREMRCGNLNIALNCINKALELSPNDKNALIARSKCYLLLGEPQKALQDAEAAIRGKLKDPKNARAIYYKAEALYHLGDFELSLVFYYRGMRIRPEFDQFRLGVQKAKEAIQNILGNTVIPIPGESQTEAEVSQKGSRPKTCNPSQKASFTESNSKKVATEKESVPKNQPKRVRPETSKIKSSEPNLLGQLNVDKKYLQNLLKCPDIKAANQESANHITVYAEEGISFLKSRQEFWRQQRACHIPLQKKLNNHKQ